MGSLMRRTFNTGLRAGLLAGTAALAACSSSMPDFSQFKLPNPRQFLPSNSDTYVPPASARAFRPVGPQDLVDTQGLCPGMATGAEVAAGSDAGAAAPPPPAVPPGAGVAPGSDAGAAAPPPPAVPGTIGLDMTECEVVRAAGQPQRVD